MNTAIRTRFAPSPTGYMHIGNLRTALYAYLFARANDGTFILRIEDTDRSRYVADAVDFIRRTLDAAGIVPDEGPDDIGGDYGPYVQSERMEIYKKYAEQLVATGHAYRCFCNHTEEVPPAEGEKSFGGYPRTCRDLPPEEIEARLARGEAYVIRQKMPLTGETTFYDVLHGNVTIPNTELEDQVLLKSDGMPTYNFANVIDDRLMKVSHIIRGTEFITSTPKHVLLYEAFGWEPPVFVHLAPVMGRDEETGKTSKLSKRHGATSFNDLVEAGYPAAAIVNYVALLGWSPKTTNQEVFSMDELIECFSLEGLSKSPAVFDYDKLGWMSGEYFKAMTDEEFAEAARPLPVICPRISGRGGRRLQSCSRRASQNSATFDPRSPFSSKRLPLMPASMRISGTRLRLQRRRSCCPRSSRFSRRSLRRIGRTTSSMRSLRSVLSARAGARGRSCGCCALRRRDRRSHRAAQRRFCRFLDARQGLHDCTRHLIV